MTTILIVGACVLVFALMGAVASDLADLIMGAPYYFRPKTIFEWLARSFMGVVVLLLYLISLAALYLGISITIEKVWP